MHRVNRPAKGRFQSPATSGCRLFFLFACCSLLIANETQQDEVTSTTNQNVEINNNQETIKYGNRKTNNYNFLEHKYAPTQWTQLVLNVGKSKDKLRKSRPPTVEEYEIKQRILHVYQRAIDELGAAAHQSPHLVHLGRILTALNPKYIATDRVMRVAFADPNDPDSLPEVVPPELETTPHEQHQQDVAAHVESLIEALTKSQLSGGVQAANKLELSGDDDDIDSTVNGKLDELHDRFQQIVIWNKSFAHKLFALDEDRFTPTQVAFKRLIQCLSYPMACQRKPKVAKPTKRAKLDGSPPSPARPMQSLEDLVAEQSGGDQATLAEAEAQAEASYIEPVEEKLPPPRQVAMVQSGRSPARNIAHLAREQPATVSYSHPPRRRYADQRPPSPSPQPAVAARTSLKRLRAAGVPAQQQDYTPHAVSNTTPSGRASQQAYDQEHLDSRDYPNGYQPSADSRYGQGSLPSAYENYSNRLRYQAQNVDRYPSGDGEGYAQPTDLDLPERLLRRYSPNYRNDVRAIREARQMGHPKQQ